MYFLKSTFDGFKINASKPFILFSSVFDVGADALFAAVLLDGELTTLVYIAAGLLASIVLVNAVAILLTVRFENKTNPEFKQWQQHSIVPCSVMSLLSLANSEGLMMVSAASNKKPKVEEAEGKKYKSASWFSAPVSEDFGTKLRLAGYWSILADDIGFMAIQIVRFSAKEIFNLTRHFC